MNDSVEFPTELNMREYTNSYLNKESMEEDEYYRYRLRGVIIHYGRADYGHYYSLIKREAEWYVFNDSDTKTFNIKNLRNEAFGGKNSSKSAYVLFYEREKNFDKRKKAIANFTGFRMNGNSNGIREDRVLEEKNQVVDNEFAGFVGNVLSVEDCLEYMIFVKGLYKSGRTFFELYTKYFLLFKIRDNKKLDLCDNYNRIVELCDNSLSGSIYILENFTNQEIFFEFFVECPIEEFRLYFYGLFRKIIKKINHSFFNCDVNEKEVILNFIKKLIKYTDIVIKEGFFSISVIYLLNDITESPNLRDLLQESDFDKLIRNYNTKEEYIEITENEDTEFESEFIMLPRYRNRKEKGTASKKTSAVNVLPTKNTEKEFLAMFFKISVFHFITNKIDFERVYRDSEFWIEYFANLTKIRAAYLYADSMHNLLKEDPEFLSMVLEEIKITATNFKLVFVVYKEILIEKSRWEKLVSKTIIDKIIALTDDRGLINNFILFDSLVRLIAFLCSESFHFFKTFKQSKISFKLNKTNENFIFWQKKSTFSCTCLSEKEDNRLYRGRDISYRYTTDDYVKYKIHFDKVEGCLNRKVEKHL